MLLRYFPIAAVTLLENNTRWAIRHLVDCGAPFNERATELLSGNFTIKNLLPLIGQRITLGDLAAQSVSVNQIEDIDNHLSVLMSSQKDKSKFLTELRHQHTYESMALDECSDETLLLPSGDKAIAAVKDVFKLRHILVHELVPQDTVKLQSMQASLILVQEFIIAMQHFCFELAEPGSTAQSQLSMNVSAWDRLESSMQLMDGLVEELKLKLSRTKRNQLASAQLKFIKYLDAEQKFFLNPFEGGSLAPYTEAGYRNRIVKSRIEHLREFLQMFEPVPESPGEDEDGDMV